MEEAREFIGKDRVDVVIHHSPCDDGHAAAALFYHRCYLEQAVARALFDFAAQSR